MTKQSRPTAQDDPHQNGTIPGVNKNIPLGLAANDREIVCAGMAASLYEAYPPGSEIPDEGDLCVHFQLRNRHQRPGAHCVVRVDKTDKRRITVNATTKHIE